MIKVKEIEPILSKMKYTYHKNIFTEKVMLKPFTYEYNIKHLNFHLNRMAAFHHYSKKMLEGLIKYMSAKK